MSKKLTYEFVKEHIESFNYQLLSKEYKNAKTKLLVQCNEDHEYEVTWNDFQQGMRCPECYKKNIRGQSRKLSFEYIKEQIEMIEGYKLLSKEYKGSQSKLKIKCDKDHIFKMSWSNIKTGYRCSECANNIKLTYDFVRKYIESFGYKLLSKEYKNAHTKLKIKCDKDHEYTIKWNTFKTGCRCPECNRNNITSEAERKIQLFVSEHTNNVICNDRTQLLNPNTGCNLELDVWLPRLNKAIEYNGTYWHSLSDAIERDKIKQDECKKLGINLLTILEEDYIIDKDKELQKIKEFINEE